MIKKFKNNKTKSCLERKCPTKAQIRFIINIFKDKVDLLKESIHLRELFKIQITRKQFKHNVINF